MVEELSLYFHIPFCRKKCPYCHFYVIPENTSHKELLLDATLLEWQQKLPLIGNATIRSIYFGGGTPSLFVDGIEKILTLIFQSGLQIPSDVEITIEANPDDITADLVQKILSCGINRLSLGVQSLVDNTLITIGREHNASKALDAIKTASENGMKNISIDLMYDLPEQTASSFQKTLDILPSLPITHISLYNLDILPGTNFYKTRKKLEKTLPSDALSLQLHNMAITSICDAGFKRYEISAFAKENLISKHNTGYWLGRNHLGYGPSSFSFFNGSRFQNVVSLSKYASKLKSSESPLSFEETLPKEQRIKEQFCVQLRLLRGIDIPIFEQKWGHLPSDMQSEIDKLTLEGFLTQSNSIIALSEKGLLFHDEIAVRLI